MSCNVLDYSIDVSKIRGTYAIRICNSACIDYGYKTMVVKCDYSLPVSGAGPKQHH